MEDSRAPGRSGPAARREFCGSGLLGLYAPRCRRRGTSRRLALDRGSGPGSDEVRAIGGSCRHQGGDGGRRSGLLESCSCRSVPVFVATGAWPLALPVGAIADFFSVIKIRRLGLRSDFASRPRLPGGGRSRRSLPAGRGRDRPSPFTGQGLGARAGCGRDRGASFSRAASIRRPRRASFSRGRLVAHVRGSAGSPPGRSHGTTRRRAARSASLRRGSWTSARGPSAPFVGVR